MEQTLKSDLTGPADRFKNSNFGQAWLVLVLALAFGAALAAVQVNLSQIIAANKLNEALLRVPELVWGADSADKMAGPGKAVEIAPGSLKIENNGKMRYYPLFRVKLDGKLAGWVVKAGGQGYADKIELLIGLDPKAEIISGLFVLEQKETPGLGNKIIYPQWRNQFIDKKTDQPLVVEKGAGKTPLSINAITGATISSRSVIGIVNRAIGDIKGKLMPGSIRFTERRL